MRRGKRARICTYGVGLTPREYDEEGYAEAEEAALLNLNGLPVMSPTGSHWTATGRPLGVQGSVWKGNRARLACGNRLNAYLSQEC